MGSRLDSHDMHAVLDMPAMEADVLVRTEPRVWMDLSSSAPPAGKEKVVILLPGQ